MLLSGLVNIVDHPPDVAVGRQKYMLRHKSRPAQKASILQRHLIMNVRAYLYPGISIVCTYNFIWDHLQEKQPVTLCMLATSGGHAVGDIRGVTSCCQDEINNDMLTRCKENK